MMIKSTELPIYFGINERTIRKWLTSKKLNGIKKKGVWYVGEQDLQYFMEKFPKYTNAVLDIFSDFNLKLNKKRYKSQRY
jgi:hypothetical protein